MKGFYLEVCEDFDWIVIPQTGVIIQIIKDEQNAYQSSLNYFTSNEVDFSEWSKEEMSIDPNAEDYLIKIAEDVNAIKAWLQQGATNEEQPILIAERDDADKSLKIHDKRRFEKIFQNYEQH